MASRGADVGQGGERHETPVAARGKWRQRVMMKDEAVLMVRVAFSLIFLGALALGWWIARNDRRFFRGRPGDFQRDEWHAVVYKDDGLGDLDPCGRD